MVSPVTSEDSDKLSELEAIQKELEELLVTKEELEKQGTSLTLSNGSTLTLIYLLKQLSLRKETV